MIEAYDWWEKIPNASGLLEAVRTSILGQKSTALLLPKNVPWHDQMHYKLNVMLDAASSRAWNDPDCPADIEPGKFILKEYFKEEVRRRYIPSVGYERLIAENDNASRIKETIILLKMHSAKQLDDWVKFTSAYEKEKRSSKTPHGLFILEYCGEDTPKLPPSFPAVKWSDHIHDYDKHIYAMISVSGVKESLPVLEYLSEFISLVSGNDVELAAELAKHGTQCIEAPQKVFERINSEAVRSDGSFYNISFEENNLARILWEAQIKVLFPQIEKFKNKLIAENKRSFDGDFTYTTAYGKEKTDYQELEIGEILHLNTTGKICLNKDIEKKAVMFKRARDCLAHFTPLSFEDTIKILGEKL